MRPHEYDKAPSIPALQRFRDFIAASIAFPGSLVTTSCWLLCVYCLVFYQYGTLNKKYYWTLKKLTNICTDGY